MPGLLAALLLVDVTGCGGSGAGSTTPTDAGGGAGADADGGTRVDADAGSGADSNGMPMDSGDAGTLTDARESESLPPDGGLRLEAGADAGAGPLPCDIAAQAGTPCVAAYSMARPLFASYAGSLFRLQRDSDGTTRDIGMVNGLADTAAAASFCQATTCHYVIAYDQSTYRLDAINSVRSDSTLQPSPPTLVTMQVQGKTIPYWRDGFLQAGSRANSASSNGGMPVGSVPVTQYAIAAPDSRPGGCCYDFGEAETTISDTGAGHMFALNLGPLGGVGMDLENGGIYGGGSYGGTGTFTTPYVMFGKTDGVSLFTLKYAGVEQPLENVSGTAPSCPGTLTFYNQSLSCFGYGPMYLEGGLTIGAGGDGSGGQPVVAGAFIEGVVFAAQTSDATDDAIQASINRLFGP